MNKNILRNITFIAGLIAIISLSIVYGLLVETYEKDKPVKYEVGNLNFEITGSFKDTLAYPGINLIENAYSIVNKSTIDVNLRIIIKYYLGDSLQELSIDDLVQVYDFNNNLIWQLEEDGFYHYRENDGVITTATTIPLFSNLTLDGYKFGNEYQNQKIKIKLIVQAKQAKHVTWQDLGEKLLNP